MKYNIDITELWNVKFDHLYTPDGIQQIGAIVTKYNKQCYALMFETGVIVECSDDHLFETTEGWVKSTDVDISHDVLCETGLTKLVKRKYIGVADVYDLEVLHDNHRYYSEGISSHNTGKSSTANAILKEIGGEALWINASMEKGIDVLRGKILNFASQSSFDDSVKIVVMDEVDNISRDAQFAYRGFCDEYSQNCRFIFTGNYKEKIIQPLLDRMELYDFNSFRKEDMIKPIFERLKFILENENITFNPKHLIPIINTHYPSIRSMVGAIQKYSNNGQFVLNESELDNINAFDQVMEMLTPTTYTELIQQVNRLNAPDNMFTFLYKNANTFFKPEVYPNVIVIVAKYQAMADGVRDKQLNLAACLTELMPLKNR